MQARPIYRVKAGDVTGASARLAAHASYPRTNYAAADMSAQSVAGWLPSLLSADAEWLGERDISVARIRDLGRNEPWAQSAIDRLVDMTVGATFRLNAKPDAQALGVSEDEARAYGQRIETRFRAYAEDPTFRGDVERGLPLVGQIGLAARELFQVGEGLGVLRWKPRHGWPYATRLQVIDADRLSNPYGAPDSARLRGGVELDEDGAPIAYHIRRAHPGDMWSDASAWAWERIPRFDDIQGWERPKVLHLFEKRRPGQSRGVSRLVAALVKTRLLSRYSEAEVKAAAINGSIVGAIYTQLGGEFAAEALGGSSITGNAGTNWDALSDQRAKFYSSRGFRADDARFVSLYPSDKLEMNTQQRQVSGFPAFQTSFLQSFAASLGLSYEQLSMDWSRVNYSSARAALNEVWRSIQRLRATIIWGFVQPFYTAWLEDALDTGDVVPPAGAADFYEQPAAHVRAEWIGPGRGYVDPVKEAQAAVMRIKARISTLEREVAEQGGDWQLVLAQIAREEGELSRLGVAPPGDGEDVPPAAEDEADLVGHNGGLPLDE